MEAAQVLIKHEADLSKVTLTKIEDPDNGDTGGNGWNASQNYYYVGGVVGNQKHGFGLDSKYESDSDHSARTDGGSSTWEVWVNGDRVWSNCFFKYRR